jgi:hypothetical protein
MPKIFGKISEKAEFFGKNSRKTSEKAENIRFSYTLFL